MTNFSPLSRVTESSLTGGLQLAIERGMQALARSERSISSGRKYATLADAPLSTRRLVSQERWAERGEKYQKNISLATSRLGASEAALAEMEEIVVSAKVIALGQVDGSATELTRRNAAIEISHMVEEMVALANRQFGGRYLFAGSRNDRPAFERTGNYVAYAGDDRASLVEVAEGLFAADGQTGVQAFGAWSTEIRGRSDLDPILLEDTSLSALNNGRGVRLGEIEIRSGSDFVRVDLSGARTAGDVVDRINATEFATATIAADGTGFELTLAGGGLSVYDVNGGSTAIDLGLAQTGAGATLTGADVDPRLQLGDTLSALRGGLGLTAGTFTIANGDSSVTIDTATLTTVEQLLNAIERAGIGVIARLADDGRGIDLRSRLSGAALTVTEGSATVADELGFIIPSAEHTIEILNDGRGVSYADGDDIRITLGDGTIIDADLTAGATLGSIAAAINADPANAGKLLVEVVEGEHRLRLTDLSGGAAEMTVGALSGSFAVNGLGIAGSSTGGVLEGSGLAPSGHRVQGVFEGVGLLAEGLTTNDTRAIERSIAVLEDAQQILLDARGRVGTGIRRLEISERRMELEVLSTREWISQEGDTDMAAALLDYTRQQTVLQASLQTGGRMLQQSLLDFLS